MSDGTGPLTPSKVSLRLTTAACILGLVGIFFSIIMLISSTVCAGEGGMPGLGSM